MEPTTLTLRPLGVRTLIDYKDIVELENLIT